MEFFQPKIIDFESKQKLYEVAAEHVFSVIFDTLGLEGLFRLAVSGGKTPMNLYQKLGHETALEWESVELYQTDERFSSNPDELNQFEILKNFGEDTISRLKSLSLIKTTESVGGDIDLAVKNYSEILETLDEVLFDMTILGIGADGHIASLFAKQAYLKHTKELVLATKAPAEFVSPQRISLSMESVLNAKELVVLVVGSEKKGIVQEIISGQKSASEFPAKFLLLHPRVTIFQCTDEE